MHGTRVCEKTPPLRQFLLIVILLLVVGVCYVPCIRVCVIIFSGLENFGKNHADKDRQQEGDNGRDLRQIGFQGADKVL